MAPEAGNPAHISLRFRSICGRNIWGFSMADDTHFSGPKKGLLRVFVKIFARPGILPQTVNILPFPCNKGLGNRAELRIFELRRTRY